MLSWCILISACRTTQSVPNEPDPDIKLLINTIIQDRGGNAREVCIRNSTVSFGSSSDLELMRQTGLFTKRELYIIDSTLSVPSINWKSVVGNDYVFKNRKECTGLSLPAFLDDSQEAVIYKSFFGGNEYEIYHKQADIWVHDTTILRMFESY